MSYINVIYINAKKPAEFCLDPLASIPVTRQVFCLHTLLFHLDSRIQDFFGRAYPHKLFVKSDKISETPVFYRISDLVPLIT